MSEILRGVDAALQHYKHGFIPLPIPPASKACSMSGWTTFKPISEQDIIEQFSLLQTQHPNQTLNNGLLVGSPSQSRVSIDLDWMEAEALAKLLLKPTWSFGRDVDNSYHIRHMIYKSPGAASVKLNAPKSLVSDASQRCIIELLSDGKQIVAPGSVHKSGADIKWRIAPDQRDIVEISAADLTYKLHIIAGAALIVRIWDEGIRNDLSMYLPGAMLHAGWPENQVVDVMTAILKTVNDDTAPKKRALAVQATLDKFRAGEDVGGFNKLCEVLSDTAVCTCLKKWWQLGDHTSVLTFNGQSKAAAIAVQQDSTDAQIEREFIGRDKWPEPLVPAAYYGLAGDITRTIEPHTESDPAAVLVQLLVTFGSVIGGSAYYRIGKTKHHMNLFVTLVGESSKSRKGTGLDMVMGCLQSAVPETYFQCINSGLSSGEGLIWAVRDEVSKLNKDGDIVVVDSGVSDKRLLVTESEFSRVLAAFGRENNTLSMVLRDAWDSKRLQSMVKNSPAIATDPHIAVIGHITRAEVLKRLETTEAANGLGNRFLWVCVRRSKLLPHGGNLHDSDLAPYTQRLKEAYELASKYGEMTRTEAGNVRWEQAYSQLSQTLPGLSGALLARGEAQVLRLSCIYALLDCKQQVDAVHIDAAMAIWRYCEQSVQHVFGASLGDAIADTILQKLRTVPAGLTRTEISGLFNNNQSSTIINAALTELEAQTLIRTQVERHNPGRPVTRVFAT